MKDSKNLVIGMLCAVVCIMAVAYAAFSTTLQVNGTATISSNWKVEFTDVTCSATPVAGGATSITTESGEVKLAAEGDYNATTATFDVTFLQPGDTALCQITVKNSGTLNAVVDTLTISEPEGGVIDYEVTKIAKGDKLAAGASATFDVSVKYLDTDDQPESLSKELSVTAIYAQDLAA